MNIDYAKVDESALENLPAHSSVDRVSTNHASLYIAHHDEGCSQLECIAVALIDGMITSCFNYS